MKSLSLLLLICLCSLTLGISSAHAATGSLPANVNFGKVESARLERQNQERAKLSLKLFTGNTLLKKSAQARAENLKTIGTTTHKRKIWDGYYNYRSIKNRFSDQGVGFDDESGTMFSESLWRWYYSCKKADCTDAFIKSIKSTFNFFMSEKYKRSQPHYQAIVSKNFTALGLGVAVNGKKYYLVSHYGKNVTKTKSPTLAKAGK